MVLFIVSLFRGNGKDPSVVGVTKCQAADHILLAIIIVAGFVFTGIASYWSLLDYRIKEALNYNFQKSDIKMTAKPIIILSLVGFSSGFLQAGFGIGSAFVIMPPVKAFNQAPAVASATAMFIATLNTLSATLVLIIFEKIDLVYTLMLCIFTAITTIPGIIC